MADGLNFLILRLWYTTSPRWTFGKTTKEAQHCRDYTSRSIYLDSPDITHVTSPCRCSLLTDGRRCHPAHLRLTETCFSEAMPGLHVWYIHLPIHLEHVGGQIRTLFQGMGCWDYILGERAIKPRCYPDACIAMSPTSMKILLYCHRPFFGIKESSRDMLQSGINYH